MSWRCFQLTSELLSPLHIGYHKVGSVQRTRYYIPARNMIAAFAERLVRTGQRDGSYSSSLAWVRQHLAFTYLFVFGSDGLLNPQYTDGGLRYGKLKPYNFEGLPRLAEQQTEQLLYGGLKPQELESRYIRARVTTAIEPSAGSAQDESLHEVEFISPYILNCEPSPCRTRLSGYVFMDADALNTLSSNFTSTGCFREIDIGGERRYGFGRLRLENKPAQDVLGDRLELDASRPRIAVPGGEPLLAHVRVNGLSARGAIEPLVGRETQGNDSGRFGRALTRGQVCWVPGSICNIDQKFEIAQDGLWQVVK